MTVCDRILPMLDKVKRTGRGYIAACPAHSDKSPSLSIREADDGRLLVKCWAGCDVGSIVAALGLDLRDLFPDRPGHAGGGHSRERRPWSAADLLALAAHEATVCVLIAADMLNGREADRDRLIEAAARLADMVEAARG